MFIQPCDLLSCGRFRAARQKVLFGAILSSYIFAMLNTVIETSFDWTNLRIIADILATQDINAEEVYIFPAFLTSICNAYNVRMP